MKKTIFFFMIAFLFLVSVSFVCGKGNDDTRPSMIIEASSACMNKDVTVKVSNQKGTLLEGVDIDVIVRSRKVAYGKTNEEGLFIFRAKEMGANQMTLKKENYKDANIQLNVSNCVVTTIETSIATTSFETTSSLQTTTMITEIPTTSYETTSSTMFSCNGNGRCDAGENYNKCPGECLSGGLDGLCDRASDGVCDPDCYRKDDKDCLCNNNTFCEPEFESVVNCLSDCPSGASDGVCDEITDGICDKDCPDGKGDADCNKADYSTMLAPLIIILILFGAFAAFNMRREATKHHVENSKEDLVEDIKKRLRDGEDPAAIKKELATLGQDASLLEKAEKTIWE
ncbi:MAG: hypothetical protein WAX07_07090 [Candidatus Altiarchaeia archaeon]